MDAKERLRLYLEQRRELGEADLVLDQLPVDDVLSILGVAKGATSGKARQKTSSTEGGSAAPSQRAQVDSSDAHSAKAERRSEPTSAAPSAAGESLDAPEAVVPPAPPAPRFDPNAPGSADWRATLQRADASPEGKPVGGPTAGSAADPAPELSLPGGDSLPAWLAALGLPAGIRVGGADNAGRDLANASTKDHGNDDASTDSATALNAIENAIAACTACALHSTATHPVPGEGNPHADFVCVGEAPGQNEDESGRPFVGPAGQLLNKILGAIALTRDDVFICNVLKHRPPGNRNPQPDEVHACRPFLEQQLGVLKPRVILALGTFAAQTLLNTKQSLGALRGQVHLYSGVPLIVTYHPAALLRNEAWKRPTWQDVQLAQRILDASRAAHPQ